MCVLVSLQTPLTSSTARCAIQLAHYRMANETLRMRLKEARSSTSHAGGGGNGSESSPAGATKTSPEAALDTAALDAAVAAVEVPPGATPEEAIQHLKLAVATAQQRLAVRTTLHERELGGARAHSDQLKAELDDKEAELVRAHVRQRFAPAIMLCDIPHRSIPMTTTG